MLRIRIYPSRGAERYLARNPMLHKNPAMEKAKDFFHVLLDCYSSRDYNSAKLKELLNRRRLCSLPHKLEKAFSVADRMVGVIVFEGSDKVGCEVNFYEPGCDVGESCYAVEAIFDLNDSSRTTLLQSSFESVLLAK